MRRASRVSGASRPVLAGLALAALLAATACGVPADRAPRRVEPPVGTVPIDPAASSDALGNVPEPLCLIRDDRLVRLNRLVPVWPTVETQLRHLLAGPDTVERAAGYTSALTGSMTVTGVRLARGHVTVEVDVAPEEAGRSDEVLAYGQIVCTLTTRSDVVGVSFVHDGQPLGVPRADGSLTSDPLSAGDYASLMS